MVFLRTVFIRPLAFCSLFVAVGCSTPGENVGFSGTIEVATAEPESVRPSSSEILGVPNGQSTPDGPRAEYITGNGKFVQEVKSVPPVRVRDDGAVSLTFKNTDIRIVIRAVLGDTLQATYVIDPRVNGTVTLETSGPISRQALRTTLEALLKTKGYALVESSDGIFVLPVEDAPRTVQRIGIGVPSSVNLPGFAVQVVPLSYTMPSEMQELIEPFAPRGGILRADDSRRILILAGTSQELAAMLRAIETFDVSRMAGMSFAIFNLQYVEADQMVKELEPLFFTGEGEAAAPVKFIPVTRINRVIAISAKRELLKDVESWIERLDLGESSPGRRIYVYHVKNGRATDMAETLNQILGSGGRGLNRFSNRNTRGTSQNGTNGFNNTPVSRGIDSRRAEDPYSEIRIVPNEESNSIMIMGTPSEFAIVETALKQIDKPPRQVLVEVTLAEVGLTDELRYGLQWHFEFGSNTVAFGQSASPSPQFPGFSWSNTSNSSASAVLNAIESMTDVKVISSPKILVLNNESATIQVGDEVPVPTASAVSTNDSNAPIVNSISYRNTGVILTVTPRINEGGLVMLDVEQELSNVVETASSGIDAPTVQQRKMTSSIAVQNGSTIALGGLIDSNTSRVHSGVPLLKDLPVLGNAFRSTDLVERRKELIVLLTPRIIRDVQETREVMDYLSREFRSLLAPASEGSSAGDEIRASDSP